MANTHKTSSRNQAAREALQTLASLNAAERQAIIDRVGGRIPTIEGHLTSPYNTCALITQNANVTVVGGYQQWLRAGRQVRKGEQALYLFVPTTPIKKQEAGSASVESQTLNAGGVRFRMVPVFDIAQTEEVSGHEAISHGATNR
jgi:hypothetical protein